MEFFREEGKAHAGEFLMGFWKDKDLTYSLGYGINKF